MSQWAGASQRPASAGACPAPQTPCPALLIRGAATSAPPISSLRPPRALAPPWTLLPLLNHTLSPPSDLCLQTSARVTTHQPPSEVTAS